jgi:hypothetical protein
VEQALHQLISAVPFTIPDSILSSARETILIVGEKKDALIQGCEKRGRSGRD